MMRLAPGSAANVFNRLCEEDDMVFFFGILGPGRLQRRPSDEAPAKASFFGGLPDAALGAVPLSRAEQDACFLQGKAPEPFFRDEDGLVRTQ
jgi:hypothetical protein